jgi:hypothetical protein
MLLFYFSYFILHFSLWSTLVSRGPHWSSKPRFKLGTSHRTKLRRALLRYCTLLTIELRRTLLSSAAHLLSSAAPIVSYALSFAAFWLSFTETWNLKPETSHPAHVCFPTPFLLPAWLRRIPKLFLASLASLASTVVWTLTAELRPLDGGFLPTSPAPLLYTLLCEYTTLHCKKVYRFFRPQPGCHKSNSLRPGMINYSRE